MYHWEPSDSCNISIGRFCKCFLSYTYVSCLFCLICRYSWYLLSINNEQSTLVIYIHIQMSHSHADKLYPLIFLQLVVRYFMSVEQFMLLRWSMKLINQIILNTYFICPEIGRHWINECKTRKIAIIYFLPDEKKVYYIV